MNKKSVVIFSGYNDRAVVAFCRYAKQHMIPVYIIAKNKDDKILSTEYKEKVLLIRSSADLNIKLIIDSISFIKKSKNIQNIFILPSTEYLNRILLENKKKLEIENIDFGLCEKDLYNIISDKYSFCEICNENGIKVPEQLSSPNKFPFVLKQRTYKSSNGNYQNPIIIKDKRQFEKHSSLVGNKENFIQEFIGGKSYYLLFYLSKNYQRVYSQRNLIQQHNGASIVLAQTSNIHEHKIADSFLKLLTKLRFYGLIMIELKFHNDHFYMIEANPRLWGPSQLILDSNMVLWDLFAFDNGLIDELPTRNYRESWYFWSGGIRENQTQMLPLSYHSFNQENFLENYSFFNGNDVYCKKDTFDLYIQECHEDI